METIILTGRNSRLSLLQIEVVKSKIKAAFPEIEVIVKPRSTRGDQLQDIPLQTVEGTDFFTEDIFESLETGEADIAVHSLKDMSAEHFFGGNFFSVVDRDDIRDVAIFRKDITTRLAPGNEIVIGTCSPRRELMAVHFLQHALPKLNHDFKIKTKVIRGNVETRLQKLDAGGYDGIILAAAGLNRLLRSAVDATLIQELLRDKRFMVLPLFECVPAPCQGAIVAEAMPQNKSAVRILEQINHAGLLEQCIQEKKTALRYGAGCDQKFGVTTIPYGSQEVIYAAGTDGNGNEFDHWFGLPNLNAKGRNIFDASEESQCWFGFEPANVQKEIEKSIVFVSNHKAIHHPAQLNTRRVWAAGSKTWLKLAQKGIWVEGCADGLGLESLTKTWQSPLVSINQEDVLILTNESATTHWNRKGWASLGAYKISFRNRSPVDQIQSADIIFWSSIRQYQFMRHLVKKDVVHTCPHGETAMQLKAVGLKPIIFPTIQSFKQWKKIHIPSRTEG